MLHCKVAKKSKPMFQIDVDITKIVVPVRFSLGTIPKITPKLYYIVLMRFLTNQSFSVTISHLLQNSHQICNMDCQTFPTICFSKIFSVLYTSLYMLLYLDVYP